VAFLFYVQHFFKISLFVGAFFTNYNPESEKSGKIFGTYLISSYICNVFLLTNESAEADK